MTSLERAAAYLKKMGPKAALAIVPLALATLPAQASILFNYSTGNWNVQTAGTPVISGVVSNNAGTPLAGSLIQGIDLTGGVLFEWNSGGTITITGTWSGNGTGTNIPFPATPIMGYYDFSFESNRIEQVNYTLTYNINGILTSFPNQFNVGSSGSAGDSPVDIDVPLGKTLTDWTVTLALTFTTVNESGNFSVDAGGIGISPELSAVPEPSTFLLALPVAGLLIVRRRRRKL
jgi:uncharacterized protein (TIGR03382 family)